MHPWTINEVQRGATSRFGNKTIYFVVWNVGQGQWATAILPFTCMHFDMGGEFYPIRKILNYCQNKVNVIYLSHWDLDHISGVKKFASLTGNLSCLMAEPLGKPPSIHKAQLLLDLPHCTRSRPEANLVYELSKTQGSLNKKYSPLNEEFSDQDKAEEEGLFQNSVTKHLGLLSNESSQVFWFKKVLIPGDSPQKQEKKWDRSKLLSNTHFLLLGHHGSRTSTSLDLLEHLGHLKLGIASARKYRYGHPHKETILRMKKFRHPLLSTEDWGNIWLELESNK